MYYVGDRTENSQSYVKGLPPTNRFPAAPFSVNVPPAQTSAHVFFGLPPPSIRTEVAETSCVPASKFTMTFVAEVRAASAALTPCAIVLKGAPLFPAAASDPAAGSTKYSLVVNVVGQAAPACSRTTQAVTRTAARNITEKRANKEFGVTKDTVRASVQTQRDLRVAILLLTF